MDMDLQTTDMLKIHVCNVEIRFFMIDFYFMFYVTANAQSVLQCYKVWSCWCHSSLKPASMVVVERVRKYVLPVGSDNVLFMLWKFT